MRASNSEFGAPSVEIGEKTDLSGIDFDLINSFCNDNNSSDIPRSSVSVQPSLYYELGELTSIQVEGQNQELPHFEELIPLPVTQQQQELADQDGYNINFESFSNNGEENCFMLPITEVVDLNSVSSVTLIPAEDIEFEVLDHPRTSGPNILQQALDEIEQLLPPYKEHENISSPSHSFLSEIRSPEAMSDDGSTSGYISGTDSASVGSPQRRISTEIATPREKQNQVCRNYRARKKEKETAQDILLRKVSEENKKLKAKEKMLADKVKRLTEFYLVSIKSGHVTFKK